jgi:AraC family transcriptional regulator of adaptative response / DNA-3-methyladenine glycosylase II
VVSRALRLISEGVLDEGSVEDLANRLGVGSRQLRRLFGEHLGASPVKIAIIHRVHFARNLIEETTLPITQIALSSGFSSIRQFNHAVRAICGQSPTDLRRSQAESPRSSQSGLVIRLGYRPPLDWEALIEFLKVRAVPGVEVVQGDSYQRTIGMGDFAGVIAVRPDKTEPFLTVRIDLPGCQHLMKVVERVRRIFDLGADPLRIADDLSRDLRLKTLIDSRPGLRVPGVWDGFELAVRAILGEQLTFAGSTALAARIARTFGSPVQSSVPGLTHTFPKPEDLANADLSQAGIHGQRNKTLKLLARGVCAGELSFSGSVDLDETISRISSIPGISQSTAHYIAMRALGEPDAFPFADAVSRTIFQGSRHSSAKLRQISEAWRPWRAYAALHLCSATIEETSRASRA